MNPFPIPGLDALQLMAIDDPRLLVELFGPPRSLRPPPEAPQHTYVLAFGLPVGGHVILVRGYAPDVGGRVIQRTHQCMVQVPEAIDLVEGLRIAGVDPGLQPGPPQADPETGAVYWESWPRPGDLPVGVGVQSVFRIPNGPPASALIIVWQQPPAPTARMLPGARALSS